MRKNLEILIISLLAILTLVLISCSGEKHLSYAQKHIEKAKKKGAFVKADTAYSYIYRTDTLYKDGKIVEITNTIIDSVPYKVVNTVTVPKHLSYQERKALKDSLEHVERMYQLETKRLDKLAKRNTELEKELRKGSKQQIKQNIKLAKFAKQTSLASTLKVFGWLALAVICIIILLKFILPK